MVIDAPEVSSLTSSQIDMADPHNSYAVQELRVKVVEALTELAAGAETGLGTCLLCRIVQQRDRVAIERATWDNQNSDSISDGETQKHVTGLLGTGVRIVEHQELKEALSLYVVGALEPQEHQEVERHLQTGCPVCQTLLREFQETASLLPSALPTSPVPSELKTRIMENVSRFPRRRMAIETEETSSSGIWGWISDSVLYPIVNPAAVVILLMLLIGTGFYALSLRSDLVTEIDQRQHVSQVLQDVDTNVTLLQQQIAERESIAEALRDELAQQGGEVIELRDTLSRRETEVEVLRRQLVERQQEMTLLRRTLTQRNAILRFLLSPTVKVVMLQGLEPAQESAGFLLFDPKEGSGLFYGFDLKPLPPQKTYQLWAIVDKPVSVGTFSVDVGQKGRLLIKKLPDISGITKFAVSLEPAGGQPQPTGAIHLVGET